MTMSMQEIFDKAATHLLRQNARSLIGGHTSRCAYRGQDGLKCAVGALIPDRFYFPEMEGGGVQSFEVQDTLRYAGVLPLNHFEGQTSIDLLVDLQCLHDRTPVVGWKMQLKDIAAEFGLHMPRLSEDCVSQIGAELDAMNERLAFRNFMADLTTQALSTEPSISTTKEGAIA